MAYYAGDAANERRLLDLLGQEWTTTPPTEPGLYCAINHHVHVRPMWVKVDKQLHVWRFGDDGYADVADFTHWLGPLPVPELPKD